MTIFNYKYFNVVHTGKKTVFPLLFRPACAHGASTKCLHGDDAHRKWGTVRNGKLRLHARTNSCHSTTPGADKTSVTR